MVTTCERSAAASTPSGESKCDLIYLAHCRDEYTAASLAALARNTDWSLVRRFRIYTDGVNWNVSFPREILFEPPIELNLAKLGGPVGVMNDYLRDASAPLWAKIDNDVIVPPGWLNQCMATMAASPELHILGIEPPASRTPAPWSPGKREPAPEHRHAADGPHPAYASTRAVGGIGMFRTAAWKDRPVMKPHSIYGGFTDWQLARNALRIGWIVPPLKLFLLDRLPIEPWVSLGRGYMARGEQRPWTMYSAAETEEIAGWWLHDTLDGRKEQIAVNS